MATSNLPKKAEDHIPYCKDQGLPYLVGAGSAGLAMQAKRVAMPVDGNIVFADQGMQDMADDAYLVVLQNQSTGAAVTTGANAGPFDIGNGQTEKFKVDRGAEQTGTFAAAAAVIVAGNAGTYALDDGDQLEVAVNGGAGTVVEYNGAPATVTGGNAEPFTLADSQTLLMQIDGGLEDTATVNAAAAVLTCVNAEPYAVANGETLDITIDRGSPQTATISGAAATATGDNAEPFALANGQTLLMKIDGGLEATATVNAAAATLTNGIAETYAVTPGDKLTFEIDRGTEQEATIAGTSGSVTSGNAETYLLVDAQVLTLSVDGGAPQTATFNTGDFVDISVATAAEVAAVIESDITGVTVTLDTGKVVITSDLVGTDSGVQVTGGSANTALGFDTDPHAGTGDAADLSAMTAAEAVAWLGGVLTDCTVALATDKVKVTSDLVGTASYVQCTGGSANTVFGFSTSEQAGTGDCADISAATAAEVSAVIESDIAGVTVSLASGKLVLTSDLVGTDSHIEITGGTARTTLGFALATHDGSGDAADLSAMTAVEAAAWLSGELTDCTVSVATDKVRITSDLAGTASYVQCGGGTATAFGFGFAEQAGSGDCENIAAATATEVAAVINADIAGVTATVAGGAVVLTSDLAGSDSSIQITGGTARVALGFALATYDGTGNVGNLAAVTAGEIAAAIGSAVADITADTSGGKPRITTDRLGTGASIVVVSTGAIESEVSFSATEVTGTGDAVDASAVTPAEVVTWLTGDITGATFAVSVDDKIIVRSGTLGLDSYIQCTGGSANTAIGFDTTEHRGTGDAAVVGATARSRAGFTITGPDVDDVLDILVIGTLKGQLS